MKIGALAEATGTPVETIRFYEREGLLPPPARAENNYRLYLPIHVEWLALIELRDSPAQDCGEINALLDEHIGHVAQRIRELRVLERDLKALRARCTSPHAVAECGILSGLDHASVSKPLSPNWPHLHGTH